MSNVPIETIAIRGVVLWALGIFVVAAISGYTSRPGRYGRRSKPVSGWIVVPLLLGKIGVWLGPTALTFALLKGMGDQDSTIQRIVGGLAFVASLWVSMIVVQFAQNGAYRLVGAKQQPIRLFSWSESKPGSKKKRKSALPRTT